MFLYLVPGHRLSSEQRAGQLHWQTFLVVLGFVLRHAEQDGCSISCYRTQCTTTRVRCCSQVESGWTDTLITYVFISPFMHADSPTPSLRECSSSVRGAVAPSASMASAASLSWASSHSTPAATRWIFSTGEYSNWGQWTADGGGLKQTPSPATYVRLDRLVRCWVLPGQRVEWCWALWWQFCCGHPGPGCAELLCSLQRFPPCAHPPE